MIVQIPPAMVPQIWSTLAPMFEKVTRTTLGCYEPEDVLDEIMSGDQLLWLAWDEERKRVDAVMTTQLVHYPRRKAVQVTFLSGSRMKTWLDEFVETIERYTKEQGATLLQGNFRRGWQRAWPGAKEYGACTYKELAA